MHVKKFTFIVLISNKSTNYLKIITKIEKKKMQKIEADIRIFSV